MKINQNKLARVGMMIAALGMVATLGGCASMDQTTKKIVARNGDQEKVLVGIPVTLGAPSAEDVCAKYPGDVRCKNVELYKGDVFWLGETTWTVYTVPALVPKNAEYPRRSIVKLRVRGDAPAYFEGVVANGLGDPECYSSGLLGRGTTGAGGIVCPKHNYDYRSANFGYGE